MQRRGNIFPVFLLFLFLSIILLSLSQTSLIKGFVSFFEHLSAPSQKTTMNVVQFFGKGSDKDEIVKLRQENKELASRLVDQKKLEKENQALRDQFETQNQSSHTLLPAHIIGMISLIPDSTTIDQIVIDKGEDDGVAAQDIVVYKDNVVGRVAKVSSRVAQVNLLTHPATSFMGQAVKEGTLGVVKSKNGREVVIDNVALSDKLEKGDIVVTKGERDSEGKGYPPDLIVGKIASVNKKATTLFQVGQIQSLIDVRKLDMVFVMTSDR